MDIEEQLKKALQPPEVPAGFAHRVLARVPEAYPAVSRPSRTLIRRVAIWAAAAVVCAGGLTAWRAERVREERVLGEKAREQVMLALRITGKKLNQAQSYVRQAVADEANGERE